MFDFNFTAHNVNVSNLIGYKQYMLIVTAIHLRKFHLGVFYVSFRTYLSK